MKLKLTIDGKTYEVDVEAEELEPRRPDFSAIGKPAAARAAAPPPPAAAPAGAAPVADESKVCRSPIAGVVVRAAVQAGQAIQANDVLLVLEAMKMETPIIADVTGTVAEIAGVRQQVSAQDLLVRITPEAKPADGELEHDA